MNAPAQGFRTYQAAAQRRQAVMRATIEAVRLRWLHTLETPITRGDRLLVVYNNAMRPAVLVSWTPRVAIVTLEDRREVKVKLTNILKREG